jgi:uncharacterized membrane protein
MFLKHLKYELLLILLVGLFIGYFSHFNVLRHQTFHSGYYDLAIMDQTVYNTYRGRILDVTNPEGMETFKRMAIHNDIILALLAPFYTIYNGPETLLILQAIIIGLGAVPLFLLAIHILRDKKVALIIAICYLLYPPLHGVVTYEFHAVAFAIPFILCMVYFAHKKQFLISFMFFFLTLITKEQVAVATGIWGLLLYLQNQYDDSEVKEFGKKIFWVSIFWFVLSIWIIIPFFRGGNHFASGRYDDFGGNPASIVINTILKPHVVVVKLLSPASFKYYIQMFAPLGFMSFLAPATLLAILPEFAINLLSNNIHMKSIVNHYTAVLIPFIFISAIYGFKKLQNRSGSIFKAAFVILLLSLFASFFFGSLPYSKNVPHFRLETKKINDTTLSNLKILLADENVSVAASDEIAPHIAHRKTIFRFSSSYGAADYVVLFTDQVKADWLNADESRAAYTALISDPRFKLVMKKGVLEVYKKISN